MESKFGFIPGTGETVANRIRRKFRMIKGGNSQLILVHYSRGQAVRKSPSPPQTYPGLNRSPFLTCAFIPCTRHGSHEPRVQSTNPLISSPTPQPSCGVRRWRKGRTKGYARHTWWPSGRERSWWCTWGDPSRHAR